MLTCADDACMRACMHGCSPSHMCPPTGFHQPLCIHCLQTKEWVKGMHNALNNKYLKLRSLTSGQAQILHNHEHYREVYDLAYAITKGVRSKDPGKSAVIDIETVERMVMDCAREMCNSQPGTGALRRCAQECARMLLLLGAAARCEDARELFIADAQKPIIVTAVKPCTLFMLLPLTSRFYAYTFSKQQDKANNNGSHTYMHLAEHIQPELCPVVALVTYMHIRYTVENDTFPDLADEARYLASKFFDKESYPTQLKQLKARFKKAGIDPGLTDQALHTFRVLATRIMVDAAARNEHVSWSNELGTGDKYYAKGVAPKALLRLSGLRDAAEEDVTNSWWAQRFCIELDDDMLAEFAPLLFSFMPALQLQVQELSAAGKLRSRLSVFQLVAFLQHCVPVAVRAALDFSLAGSKFNKHPLVSAFSRNACFQDLLHRYQEQVASGVLCMTRIPTHTEHKLQSTSMLEYLCRRQAEAAAQGASPPPLKSHASRIGVAGASTGVAAKAVASRSALTTSSLSVHATRSICRLPPPASHEASNPIEPQRDRASTMAASVSTPVASGVPYTGFYKDNNMLVLYQEWALGFNGKPGLKAQLAAGLVRIHRKARQHWCNHMKIIHFVEDYAQHNNMTPLDVAAQLPKICEGADTRNKI
eukprot:351147-Chlamydomonas_euryale.AAC.2